MSTKRPISEARGLGVLLATVLCLLNVEGAQAEVFSGECEHESQSQVLPPPITISAVDTLNALIVFARFPDGEDVTSGNLPIPTCQNCGTSWSASDVYPPAWADSLIENTTSPTIPGSLTHWFHGMSQGKHIPTGAVLDTVIVSDSTLAYWDTTYGGDIDEVLAANRRVLQQIDPLVNFANYDRDNDGFVDFVFVNWHSNRTYDTAFRRVNGGVSFLIAAGDTLQLDGKKMVQESGATISSSIAEPTPDSPVFVRHRWQTLALAVHEYSHDLVYLEGHFHSHYRSVSRYGVMQGNILPGSLLMEGYLRYEMGWIQPVEINPATTPFDTTLTLSTSYRANNKSFAILRTQANTAGTRQYFILEARQEDESGEHYNTAQPAANPQCCYRTTAVGSGLLVTHITENAPAAPSDTVCGGSCLPTGQFPLIDIETATGMFRTDGSPDPVAGRDSIDTAWNLGGQTGAAGDLLVPAPNISRTSIMAPYGNPSTHLYRNDGTSNKHRQDVRSGISIYNVEYVAGNDSMRVSVRYDGTSAVLADTVKANTKWEGLVQLMSDVVVAPGVTLEVEEGATVVAAARKDANAGGAANNRVEVLAKGQSNCLGTGTADADDVVLTSSRDASFTHFRGPGETTAAAADDWYGWRLDLEGCEWPGYGYVGCKEPISSIENTRIRYGRYGISIEDVCAPKLAGVEFTSITNNRHVYLNQTDVFLPAGRFAGGNCDSTFIASPGTWDLTEGTHVVATNSVSNDVELAGTSGKVDLVANAALSAEDGVEFRPETAVNATARDWGGLTLNVVSGECNIDGATIGHAANPVFMFYPDDVTMTNTTVHHFAETGIWVLGTYDDGVVISGCTVERGGGIADTLGDIAIFLDQADEVNLYQTTADLRDLDSETAGRGVLVVFGKTFCQTQPLEPRLLNIEECLVIGPDAPSQGIDYEGIHAYWVCGTALERDVQIVENGVYDWVNVGIDLYQSADIQITCNHVLGCDRGIDVYRTAEQTETALRFKHNRIEALLPVSSLFAFRTNDAIKAKLGPSNSLRGDNRLKVNQQNTKFIYENDSNAADTLNATFNYWYADTLLTAQGDIQGRLAPSGYSINVSSFYTSDTGVPSCYGSAVPPYPTGGGTVAALQEARSPEVPSGLSIGVPTVLSLSLAYPNPARRGATMDLAVPQGHTGPYVLEVYDIGGRRILESRREIASAGWYRLEWPGSLVGGGRASAGVYFLRVKGPEGFQETRKVTIAN